MSLPQADPQRIPGSGWGRHASLFRPFAQDPLPLLEQKIHLVYARLPWGLAMNLVVSAALTFGLFGPYRRQLVWYWLAGTFLLNALRFLDYRIYTRQPAVVGALARRHRNLMLGAGVQGLLWGIAGTLFFPSAPADQVLLFGVLFGMAAGAVRFLSALWPVFLGYLLPALVPPSLRLIFGEGLSQHLMGFLGLVYTVAMMAASSATSQWIDHSLKAAQDLDDLSAQLKSANTDLEGHRDHLEQLVRDRTRELHLANERLQGEMAAREKEHEKATQADNLYRALFETMGEGFGHVNADEVFTLVNPAGERIFGVAPGTLAGRSLNEFLDLPSQEMIRRETVLRAQGVSSTYPQELVRADGERRWLEVKSCPILDADGGYLGASAVFRDITELRQAEEALLQSERRNRAILEAMPDDIFLTTRDGRFLRFQVHESKDLPGQPESPLPASVTDVFALDVSQRFLAAFEAAVVSGQTQNFTYECPGPSGARRWEARVVRCDEASVVTLMRDITDQWCTEQRLRQSQKLESLGVLAGGVAHDMNNVLGAILGLASAHLEVQPEGSSAHAAFGVIYNAALRGGKMVRSLLGFARQGPAEEREVDLNALLREQVGLLERTTMSRVRVELDLDPLLPALRGDGNALSHAVMNLAINAVDAMDGGGSLILRTRKVDSSWVEVLVEDTGSGMPKEVLDKAMDPFFTTKEQGKGTGLGLFMVYTTVKAHGGALDLQSEPGRGTQVRMRFPASEAAPSQAPAPAERGAGGRPLKVLVVDDDELVQASTKALLDLLGHEVSSDLGGADALMRLQKGFRPDVVMLDLNMPGLNGAATLERLREFLPQVPVLLATGRSDQTALDLVESHSHVTLLPKPFTLEDLHQHLDALL